MFRIGEEVVCVDDVFEDGSKPINRGQHYIIRWIGAYDFMDNELCVRVEGVQRDMDGDKTQDYKIMRDLFHSLKQQYPDHEDVPRLDKDFSDADACLHDMPMRATRFRSLKKDHVEEMKKLLVPMPKEKVLEEA